jgi:hypothetical protein
MGTIILAVNTIVFVVLLLGGDGYGRYGGTGLGGVLGLMVLVLVVLWRVDGLGHIGMGGRV